MVKEVDVLIIGGGLTGASLLLALAGSEYRVALIEAKAFTDKIREDFDARTLALSPASIRILNMLKVWSSLQERATRIETIHVSQQRRFGSTRLRGDKQNPLGHVVEMQHIQQAFYQHLDEDSIVAPAQIISMDAEAGVVNVHHSGKDIQFKAKLIVAADGSDSIIRKLCGLTAEIKDYQQKAVVANVGLSRPHHNYAYERFTSSGPLALLPMQGLRSSLVWSLPPNEAAKLTEMDEKDFLAKLHSAFGYRLGRFEKVGERTLFPLRQVVMPQPSAWPIIFIGNAAHTLHPVAGQGFNLGLRDVALLAQAIVQKGINPSMLQFYQQARRYDQLTITHFTNGLVELFNNSFPGLSAARGLGLLALDTLPSVKGWLTQHTQGFAGTIPDLVCEIPLLPRSSYEHHL